MVDGPLFLVDRVDCVEIFTVQRLKNKKWEAKLAIKISYCIVHQIKRGIGCLCASIGAEPFSKRQNSVEQMIIF